MTGPQPLTRQRSKWTRRHAADALDGSELVEALGATHVDVWERRVHDGWLNAIVSLDPDGWHASVSFEPAAARRAMRYPTWDELADARYRLLPAELDFVMHLPPPEDYVAVHPSVFHLHEYREPAT